MKVSLEIINFECHTLENFAQTKINLLHKFDINEFATVKKFNVAKVLRFVYLVLLTRIVLLLPQLLSATTQVSLQKPIPPIFTCFSSEISFNLSYYLTAIFSKLLLSTKKLRMTKCGMIDGM